MANGFSINSLATQYADRQLANLHLAEGPRNLARKRSEYDFKVTGFNAATAATITTLFLAAVTGSVAIFVLWVLAYNVRKSFMNAILTTALPNRNLLEIAQRNLVERRDEIAHHLEIADQNWKLGYQLADFNSWMYWTPGIPAPVVEAPAPAPAPLGVRPDDHEPAPAALAGDGERGDVELERAPAEAARAADFDAHGLD